MEKVSKEQVLEQVKAAYGFVPNLFHGMASQNPAVTSAYLTASAALDNGVLTPAEREVVRLAVSAYNDCHYCTAAHRTVASGLGVNKAELEAVDALRPPSNPRLATLVHATWALMRTRAHLTSSARESLRVSGPELYELVGIIALKTISNYINRLQGTQIDEPLLPQATRPQPSSAI
jgi:uncharacterized peroxidase-related enzyme